MSKFSIKFILSMAILFICLIADGQNNTLSPYSRFGIGDITGNGFGAARALGGLSAGFRYPNQINFSNPASYSSQDTMSFVFDLGISGNYTVYETSELESIYSTANIDHMAFSFPVKKWCYMSAGLTPYSSTGYSINEQYYVAGQSILNNYQGVGGINQFYIGSSFKLYNKFAIGVNASYLFGAINYSQTATFVDPLTLEPTYGIYVTEVEKKNVVGDFNFDFGIQYFDTINENITFTLGAVFDNQNKIKSKNSVNKMLLRKDLYFPNTVDTIEFIEGAGSYSLPMNIGGGFTLNYKNRLLFGADYSIQNWSSLDQYKLSGDSLLNSSLLSVGIEYTPNPYVLKGYLKKVHYRVGGYYENTYLQVNGEQLKDYGITFGLGLPFKRYQSSFNIACELGQRGTINNNLIKESYAIWTISLTLKDLWFYKSKFD